MRTLASDTMKGNKSGRSVTGRKRNTLKSSLPEASAANHMPTLTPNTIAQSKIKQQPPRRIMRAERRSGTLSAWREAAIYNNPSPTKGTAETSPARSLPKKEKQSATSATSSTSQRARSAWRRRSILPLR